MRNPLGRTLLAILNDVARIVIDYNHVVRSGCTCGVNLMDVSHYLQLLYDYHYWANNRILIAAAGLTAEQLHNQQGHSWGSIHGILLHMLNAEWIWLRRWHGQSPSAFPSPTDFPTLDAIRDRWAALEPEMRSFVAAQTPHSLQGEVRYTTTLGATYRLSLWQMMVHVPNHGTHHRGELAAMFTALDAAHPEEDWVHYFLEQSGQR